VTGPGFYSAMSVKAIRLGRCFSLSDCVGSMSRNLALSSGRILTWKPSDDDFCQLIWRHLVRQVVTKPRVHVICGWRNFSAWWLCACVFAWWFMAPSLLERGCQRVGVDVFCQRVASSLSTVGEVCFGNVMSVRSQRRWFIQQLRSGWGRRSTVCAWICKNGKLCQVRLYVVCRWSWYDESGNLALMDVTFFISTIFLAFLVPACLCRNKLFSLSSGFSWVHGLLGFATSWQSRR
jgi:hypothetical protein